MELDILEKLLEVGDNLKPKTYRPDAEPSHVYYNRDEDGKYSRIEAEPTPRRNIASSLDAVIELTEENKTSAEIWFSRSGVIAYLDRNTRRDTISFPLALSPQMVALQNIESTGGNYDQASLVKLLRITFHGCLGPAGNLVEIIRRVKFNAVQNSESMVAHGKSSLGKSITAEVTGTGILPEDFSLSVPVFANANFASITRTVDIALEPDAATGRFQIIPFPGEIEAAISFGEGQIGVRIVEGLASEIPVLFGRPQ